MKNTMYRTDRFQNLFPHRASSELVLKRSINICILKSLIFIDMETIDCPIYNVNKNIRSNEKNEAI